MNFKCGLWRKKKNWLKFILCSFFFSEIKNNGKWGKTLFSVTKTHQRSEKKSKTRYVLISVITLNLSFVVCVPIHGYCIYLFNTFCSFLELSSSQTWNELDYFGKFEEFSTFEDNVARIHAPEVDCQEFIDKFEKSYTPVVITGN